MKLEDLRELIQMMRDNQIAEIDLEEEGKRVRVVAAQSPAQSMAPQSASVLVAAPLVAAPLAGAITGSASAVAVEQEKPQGVTINSPIVGTFYNKPSPDSPPYIKVGDEVDEETVLCIVEAMKVMNEIKAELRGRVLDILAESGHPVEFGQPLFRLLPA